MREKNSMAPNPRERVIHAKRPNTGFISMFFQISALTVGITKKGAMTSRRQILRPGKSWSSRREKSVPKIRVMARTSPTRNRVLPIATHSARWVSRSR